MNKQTLTIAVLAALASFAAVTVSAQDKAEKAPAPAKAAAPTKAAAAASTASTGKELYPKAWYDYLMKERVAQGQPDSAEARNALRDQLNTRELLAREAKKKGLDKNPDVKTQIDLSAQAVLVNAFVGDFVKSHPVSDDVLKKEYDQIKSQMGDKEYKVRHILVDNEADAKEIIAALQKGEKFEKLAERSKDPGSKANGGDLDWNAPGNFVKPFSDAMIKLQKGKFTTTPVQTQFGWHVIEVDDIREAKVPPFEEVKPQLQQRMQGQQLDAYVKDLKAKNGV
jgi:peptidyl-prolyl cis-trans isomerase C